MNIKRTLITRILRRLRLVEEESPYDKAMEEEFREIYQFCKVPHMQTEIRAYALYKAIQYIVEREVSGAFVECGVYAGFSPMVIALTLLKLGQTSRDLYLYDTFAGMTNPTEKDMDFEGNTPEEVLKHGGCKSFNEMTCASMEMVKNNVFSIGYPDEKFIFVKGDVKKTIPETIPDQIALLRLDTDWYESTKHELNHLYPKLAPNGVLIIDDYGHFKGAKEAVDEYFSENKIKLLLNRIDYTARIALKS